MSIAPIAPVREPGAARRAKRAPAVTPPALTDERPQLRRRQNPWARRALVFATCVLMLDALFGDRGLAETLRAREMYDSARQDLERIRHENATLRERARRLREDPAEVESIARAELGYVRPGEILVVVRDVKSPNETTGKQGGAGAPPLGPR